MATKVSLLVGRKGADVTTIVPGALLADAVQLLTEEAIGAVVVSDDGTTVEGILSERDIVRRLAGEGPAALEHRVADVMTRDVLTCGWETTTAELMTLMTERRIRHVPVVEDGQLVAIVSIGDVVKSRLDELADEADQLQAYVSGSY
jgi:CBS domain-containing protein